jgi:hypothetical protein
MHHWTDHLEKRQQKKRKNWETKPMLQNSHRQLIFAALKPNRARFFLLQRTDPSASKKHTSQRETDRQTDRDAQYDNLLQFLTAISPECPTPENSQPREHSLLIDFRPLNPEFGSLIEATAKARNPHLWVCSIRLKVRVTLFCASPSLLFSGRVFVFCALQ